MLGSLARIQTKILNLRGGGGCVCWSQEKLFLSPQAAHECDEARDLSLGSILF